MYIKKVKIRNKKYKYYYHNIKVNYKVKNICLGNNKENALKKLQKLMQDNIKGKLTEDHLWEIQKRSNFINLKRILFIVFGLAAGLGLIYYLSPGITGFTVYNTNLANINNLAVKLKIKELIGILIGLELMVLSYNIIYKNHLNKKVI